MKSNRGQINMLTPKIFIFYYPDENIFKTSDNKVIINMSPLVSPGQRLIFLKNKKSVEFVNNKYGIIIRLFYPVSFTQEGETNAQNS